MEPSACPSLPALSCWRTAAGCKAPFCMAWRWPSNPRLSSPGRYWRSASWWASPRKAACSSACGHWAGPCFRRCWLWCRRCWPVSPFSALRIWCPPCWRNTLARRAAIPMPRSTPSTGLRPWAATGSLRTGRSSALSPGRCWASPISCCSRRRWLLPRSSECALSGFLRFCWPRPTWWASSPLPRICTSAIWCRGCC